VLFNNHISIVIISVARFWAANLFPIGFTPDITKTIVAVFWRFFYPTTTERTLTSLFKSLDELGKLGTGERENISGVPEY